MLLMIFVNDLWTLSNIPDWLGHKAAGEDGLGLADVVFPAFLFIVGLSIPWAVQVRFKRGDSKLLIIRHIIERSLALVVMGFFMVNLESIDRSQLIIPKYLWQILMALAFFFIWNNYRGKVFGIIPEYVMKLAGIAILVFLAAIYTGRAGEGTSWMKTRWWGILGIIGWSYLLNALIYFVIRDRLMWMALVCLVLYLMNVNEFISPFDFNLRIVVGASSHASVMSGMLVSLILIRFKLKNQLKYLVPVLIGLSAVFLLFGFITRPEWGISKIHGTPSWTAICAGISSISFAILYLIADKFGYTRWADIISPAGKSTLTCYLVPYFAYALITIIGFHLPDLFVTGMVGIIKSLIFSLLIIIVTGGLNKLHISLKI
jgi:predicted acyltransferase